MSCTLTPAYHTENAYFFDEIQIYFPLKGCLDLTRFGMTGTTENNVASRKTPLH